MAHNTEKLRELLERVGALSEADVGTDIAVYHALRPATIDDLRAMHDAGDVAGYWYWMGHHPVTSSLDASIALVERMLPGWGVGFDKRAEFRPIAWVRPNDQRSGADDFRPAATAPLAILSALLRALISQAESSTLRDGLTRAKAHKMEGGSGLSSCPPAEGEGA